MGIAFYSFEDIRRAADCREIAQTLYGVTIKNGRCAAAWRGGDNPEAVSIQKDKFFDHVEKSGGGPIELAAFKFGGDIQQAQSYLGERYHLTPKTRTGPAPSHAGGSQYDKLIAEGYAEVARYEYRDTAGEVRHVTIRLQHPDKPGKRFVQGAPKPDGGIRWGLSHVDTVLYRLPEIAASDWVAICEGEKSADRLAAIGIPTTTAPMGAGRWNDCYTESLRGKHVAIFPDNDAPGREHAATVAAALHGKAASVRIIPPQSEREKGGIDDWLDEGGGHDADDILALVAAAPDWAPSADTAYTGPTEDALREAKSANTTPYRNFIPNKIEAEKRGRKVDEVQKEPRTHAAMVNDLFRRFLGFPRKVGDGRLFDFDRDTGTVIDLDTAEGLIAWIGRRGKLNPEFARGDAMITPRQLRESVLAECRRYESISMTPDWPVRPDVYYAHGPLPAPCPHRSRFLTFCGFFLPASDVDAALIRAFVCCPLWYVPGIPRPSWIIDSHDGQGSGKSNLVELVSELYGHAPIKTSKQELGINLQQLTRRCLSNSGRDARIMLVDNVTGDFQSPELADLITSKHITGMAPYGRGEETRPNNLVYAITANSATVSTDLADRSIYIHVRKPQPAELIGWKDRIQSYIDAHRLEIFADIIAMLSSHVLFPDVLPTTRFPEFELNVLQPACGDAETIAEVLAHLVGARADSNVEEDQARMIAELFESNIARALGTDIPAPVFIRSDLVNSWGRTAIQDSYEFKGRPIQLVRNLAKLRLLPQVDRHITRWPISSGKGIRHHGVAWGFTDTTEEAVVLYKGHENEVLKTWK
jgi:hypothetical protein